MALDNKCIKLLSQNYPSIESTVAEIINLEAILRLPKGTEHFLSDLHGEYEAFCHLMNNASGVIREKVDMMFSNSLTITEREKFATLIYYPKQCIDELKQENTNLKEWYKITLYRLVEICRTVASKYTRSKVRKTLPKHFDYIIDELINLDRNDFNKEEYYNEIFSSIIELGRAEAFIIAITDLIKNLAVDTLHIVGDIFDRGERPDLIIELLLKHHNCDVQWGNHDILWMGASMGSEACICNVLEISLKYGNIDLLENGYGISLRNLEYYAENNLEFDERFLPTLEDSKRITSKDCIEIAKMRKAVLYLLLKTEGQIIARNKEFNMSDRAILNFINFDDKTITLDGNVINLKYCTNDEFKTIIKDNVLKYSVEEQKLINELKMSFLCSEKLKRHLDFLITQGSLYKVYNNNLIFHGCVPLDDNKNYAVYTHKGVEYFGKAYMDYSEKVVKNTYAKFISDINYQFGLDYIWYLWCGKISPLFGRDKMTTFERLYIEDEKYYKETKNGYYYEYNDENFCRKLLKDFGVLNENSHIINGHIPVRQSEGESPIKAGGKLIVIDGGFCRAYHQKTGIAGYTLIYNSYGIRLSAHEPFDSIEKAIKNHSDIHSKVVVYEKTKNRIKVKETDIGSEISEKIKDLKELLNYYLQE